MGLSWLLCKVGRHESGQTVVPVVARGRVAGAGGGVAEQWAGANSAPPKGLPVGHSRVNTGWELVLKASVQASILKRQVEGE